MAMMGQSSNNMSTHTFGNSSNIEVNSMNMSSSGTMVGMDAGGRESNINSSLVNMTDYQSAQTLAAKAWKSLVSNSSLWRRIIHQPSLLI